MVGPTVSKQNWPFFTGGNSDYGAESYAALKIFPSPERFYSLGITTSDFGPEKEKHTSFVRNGTKGKEILKERVKGGYRFNLQIGRQIHNWTFRGGLIESKGGLGIDYNIYHLGSSFSLEVFDHRDDIGLNIRPSFYQRLWNVFYAKGTIEDATSKERRSYTLSGGIRFNDEDLKGPTWTLLVK